MSKPAGNPAAEKKEGGQPQGGPSQSVPSTGGGKASKERAVIPGHCAAVGCKASDKRFSFCEEHYEQFKFGLIKKSGDQVPDYEKKFEHYQAYKARQGARKVA